MGTCWFRAAAQRFGHTVRSHAIDRPSGSLPLKARTSSPQMAQYYAYYQVISDYQMSHVGAK